MNGNEIGSTGGIISSTPGKRSANDFAGCAEKARKHGSAKKSRSTRDDNCLAIHDNFVNEKLIERKLKMKSYFFCTILRFQY